MIYYYFIKLVSAIQENWLILQTLFGFALFQDMRPSGDDAEASEESE